MNALKKWRELKEDELYWNEKEQLKTLIETYESKHNYKIDVIISVDGSGSINKHLNKKSFFNFSNSKQLLEFLIN